MPTPKSRHPLRQFGDLAAVGRPLLVVEPRPVRDRPPDRVVPPARGIGIDDMGGAEIAMKGQMRQDRLELGLDLALEDAPVPPAGDQR